MKTILRDLLPDVNAYTRMNECQLRDEIVRLRRVQRYMPKDVADARIQLCQQRLDEIGLLSEGSSASRRLLERQRCIDSTIAAIEVLEMTL